MATKSRLPTAGLSPGQPVMMRSLPAIVSCSKSFRDGDAPGRIGEGEERGLLRCRGRASGSILRRALRTAGTFPGIAAVLPSSSSKMASFSCHLREAAPPRPTSFLADEPGHIGLRIPAPFAPRSCHSKKRRCRGQATTPGELPSHGQDHAYVEHMTLRGRGMFRWSDGPIRRASAVADRRRRRRWKPYSAVPPAAVVGRGRGRRDPAGVGCGEERAVVPGRCCRRGCRRPDQRRHRGRRAGRARVSVTLVAELPGAQPPLVMVRCTAATTERAEVRVREDRDDDS